MNTEFSTRMKEVFIYVKEEALRLGQDTIGTEHLLLGIIREGDGTAITVLKSLGLDLNDLKKVIENTITSEKKQKTNKSIDQYKIQFKRQAERALKKSILEKKKLKNPLRGEKRPFPLIGCSGASTKNSLSSETVKYWGLLTLVPLIISFTSAISVPL